jgi:hypothetical protein
MTVLRYELLWGRELGGYPDSKLNLAVNHDKDIDSAPRYHASYDLSRISGNYPSASDILQTKVLGRSFATPCEGQSFPLQESHLVVGRQGPFSGVSTPEFSGTFLELSLVMVSSLASRLYLSICASHMVVARDAWWDENFPNDRIAQDVCSDARTPPSSVSHIRWGWSTESVDLLQVQSKTVTVIYFFCSTSFPGHPLGPSHSMQPHDLADQACYPNSVSQTYTSKSLYISRKEVFWCPVGKKFLFPPKKKKKLVMRQSFLRITRY